VNLLKRIAPVIAALLLAAGFFAYRAYFLASPVETTVNIGPRKIFIGDTIDYRLTVTVEKDVLLEKPDLKAKLSSFSIKDFSEAETVHFGKRRITYEYKITKYEPGEYRVPAVKVRYREKGSHAWRDAEVRGAYIRVERLADIASGHGAVVSVSSGLAGMPGSEGAPTMERSIDSPLRLRINDIMDPRTVRTAEDWVVYGLLFLGALIVLIIMGLIVFATIKYIKREKKPLPHEVALKALSKLKYSKLLEKGKTKEFCSSLYNILVEYTKARFGMPEVKMTAREFTAWLDIAEGLSEEGKEFLRNRVSVCELVRYSGYFPSEGELDQGLEKEIEFVRMTMPLEEEVSV
jgi:hypothetical protein